VLVGIDALTERVMLLVREHIERECDLGALGGALALLLDLFGGDVLYGARKNDELGQVIGLAYVRGVWLLEQVSGQNADASVFESLIRAVVALRDAARRAALAPANGKAHLDPELLVAACQRVSQSVSQADGAPPSVRGACLGSLWSLGRLDDGKAAAVAGVRRLGLASQVGDFLAGLFALARDQTVQGDDVLRVVDEVLAALGEHDFLAALPSLRLAFAWFPPRERATIAERIAALHGHAREVAHDLMTLEDEPLLIARGGQLDSEVEALIGRYALGANP